MSLYKRGRIWWVSFTVPGRPKIAESTGTTDKVQAQRHLSGVAERRFTLIMSRGGCAQAVGRLW